MFLGPAGTGPARAGVVAEDTFSYPDTNLIGLNGGTGWSAAWSGFLTTVVAGTAVGQGDEEFQAVRAFPYVPVTSEMFVSLVVHTPASFDTDEFPGIFLLAGANGSSLAFGKTRGSNLFAVGNSGFVYSSLTCFPNTTYHLVGVTDLDQSRVSLWVNPDASDFYEPGTGVSSLGRLPQGVSEHVWNAAGTPPGQYFYEVRVEGAPPVTGKLVVAR